MGFVWKHQIEVLALIKRLHREENMTLVLVTHDVNHAVAVSNHVVGLVEGRVCFDGTPETLLDGDTLDTVFDTPFQRVPCAGQTLPLVIPGDPA